MSYFWHDTFVRPSLSPQHEESKRNEKARSFAAMNALDDLKIIFKGRQRLNELRMQKRFADAGEFLFSHHLIKGVVVPSDDTKQEGITVHTFMQLRVDYSMMLWDLHYFIAIEYDCFLPPQLVFAESSVITDYTLYNLVMPPRSSLNLAINHCVSCTLSKKWFWKLDLTWTVLVSETKIETFGFSTHTGRKIPSLHFTSVASLNRCHWMIWRVL